MASGDALTTMVFVPSPPLSIQLSLSILSIIAWSFEHCVMGHMMFLFFTMVRMSESAYVSNEGPSTSKQGNSQEIAILWLGPRVEP